MFIVRVIVIIFLLCLTTNSPLDALLESDRREAIIPYLMKPDHPIKSSLDKFFSKTRATHSVETLKAAGFENVIMRWNKLLVIKHPAFPGYIFKLYTDDEPLFRNKPEERNWFLRIRGAKKIRKEIEKAGLTGQFKVPRKWIYELPEFPEPQSDSYPKFTLIVEDEMDILPHKENLKMWASENLSTEVLDGLESIIQAVGLKDVKPDNHPFCRDGRIAFIDTNSTNKIAGYEKLIKFLSPWHQEYWISINEKYNALHTMEDE